MAYLLDYGAQDMTDLGQFLAKLNKLTAEYGYEIEGGRIQGLRLEWFVDGQQYTLRGKVR